MPAIAERSSVMPFSDMPVDELIVRALPLFFLVLSGVFCGVSALRARARRRRGVPAPGVYPGSARHVADLKAVDDGTAPNLAPWRRLSTEEQAAYDASVIHRAEESAQVAVEQAARQNVLFHP
ncbi:hypothetical protein [Streptomyces sp. NPDC001658]